MLDAATALSILTKVFVYGGALLAAGSALFELSFSWSAPALQSRLTAAILLGAPVALLAAATHFGLQAALLLGDGLAGFANADMLRLLWVTRAGDALMTLAIGAVLLLASRTVCGPVRGALCVLGAVTVAVSFALVGHANDGPPIVMHALIAAHLLGVAFWIGGLWPLKAAAEGAVPLSAAARLAERFGVLATLIVPALILAGGVAAWMLLGSLTALFSSSYGVTLMVKLGLVAGLLAFAALNKLWFTPAMIRGERAAAKALSWSIAFEIAVIAVVLSTTSVLTSIMTMPA